MSKPLVSVVMLSWNRKDEVIENVLRLEDDKYSNKEIIVVDNGSTDGTVEELSQKFPGVKIIALAKNIGIVGFNRGFEEAKGEYILVLDDDSYPEEQSIQMAIDEFKKNEKLGIAAFKIKNFHSGSTYQTDVYENGGDRLKDDKKYPGVPIKSFVGCGALIKKDMFDKVGYYADDFFLYCNEMDLALRCLGAGYEVRYFPDITAVHKVSPKNRTTERAVYYQVRNKLWILWNYSSYPYMFIKSFKFLFKHYKFAFKTKTTKAFFKAVKDALKKLPFKVKNRKKVYSQTISYNLFKI